MTTGVEYFQNIRATDEQRDDSWAPIERNSDRVPEVTPQWVANNAAALRVIDVREPDEFRGELGHVEGAENVPLREVPESAQSWQRDTPIAVICRSGGRSGRAALALEEQGFGRVVSMKGGMLEWQKLGLPVVS